MRRAATSRGARYVATRRVQVREGGESKVHIERIVRDGPRVRVEFAPGSRFEGQRVIETPNGRFILDPARRELRRLPGRADESERRLGRFVRLIQQGKLTLAEGDGGKIAGRPTRRLVLARAGRPFVALSIDPKTTVVLRRESFAPIGEPREGPAGSYVFIRFEPRAKIDPASFALPTRGYRTVLPLDDLRKLAKAEGLPLRILPIASGYRLEGARTRKTRAGTILAAFYSGGGKRLTLFASKGEFPDLPSPRGEKEGGTGSNGSPAGVALYRWRVGPVSYGLLGEETPERLRLIAGQLASP